MGALSVVMSPERTTTVATAVSVVVTNPVPLPTAVTVMSADPGATAVTSPLDDTVATDAAEVA